MFLTALCLPSQGMISLVLQCVDRLHVYSSAAHFAEVAGREAGESWKSILNSLYELLGKQCWLFKATAVSVAKDHGTPSPFRSCSLSKQFLPVPRCVQRCLLWNHLGEAWPHCPAYGAVVIFLKNIFY